MAPIIYGAAIAYLLTPIVNFLERKIIFPIFEKRHKTLQKKGRKVVRWICVTLSVFFYVPDHLCPCHDDPSAVDPKYHEYHLQFSSLCKCCGELAEFRCGKGLEAESGYDQPDQPVFQQIAGISDKYDPSSDAVHDEKHICEFSGSSCFLKNFLIGAIVSLYILADKEGFVAKAKMATYAVLPAKLGDFFLFIPCVFTHKTFWRIYQWQDPGFCNYRCIVLCGNIHHWNAICDSGQCDRWRDKRYPVFWTISWSDSVYSSYFAGRSDSESVFPDLYSGSSAV